MTLLGVIFLLISLILLFQPLRYFLYVIMFLCVFQYTAVCNIGGKGYSFQVIGELILVLRYYLQNQSITYFRIKKDPLLKAQFLLVIVAISCFLNSLFFFSGIHVYATGAMDDDVLQGGEPLHFSLSKISQIISLILHFITVKIILDIRKKIKIETVRNLFLLTVLTVVVIGYWEFVAKTTGIISFPESLFNNYSGGGGLTKQLIFGKFYRLNATFFEPSYAGAFLGAAFWTLVTMKNKMAYLLSVFVALALVFNLSGTGVMTFIGGSFLYIFFRGKKALWIILGIILSIYVVITLGKYGDLFQLMLTEKATSQSGVTRSDSFFFTMELFVKTYGIGIGIGYHRSSIFLSNMLVALGLVGTILFFRWMYLIFMPLYQQSKYYHFCLFPLIYSMTLLCAQNLSIPDLSFPPFWLGIYMAVIIPPSVPEKSRLKSNL